MIVSECNINIFAVLRRRSSVVLGNFGRNNNNYIILVETKVCGHARPEAAGLKRFSCRVFRVRFQNLNSPQNAVGVAT